MLTYRCIPAFFGKVSHVAGAAHIGIELAVDAGEYCVAGGLDQTEVNRLVVPEIACEVSPSMHLKHLFVEPADRSNRLRRRVPASELSGESLQRAHGLEGFRKACAIHGGDYGPPIREQLDEPLGRQQLDGFAQRGPRNGKPLGQDTLVQPDTRRQLALDDEITEAIHGLFVQGAARNRGYCLHRCNFCMQNAKLQAHQ